MQPFPLMRFCSIACLCLVVLRSCCSATPPQRQAHWWPLAAQPCLISNDIGYHPFHFTLFSYSMFSSISFPSSQLRSVQPSAMASKSWELGMLPPAWRRRHRGKLRNVGLPLIWDEPSSFCRPITHFLMRTWFSSSSSWFSAWPCFELRLKRVISWALMH